MTKDELLVKLKALRDCGDIEHAHIQADDLLCEFIGDKDISQAYSDVPKWYS